MEIRGVHRVRPLGYVIAGVVVAGALGLAIWTVRRAPVSTDDATIDAEVVHIAAAVGGRIVDLPVHENDRVRRGQLLFRIDAEPYRNALAAAQAKLDLAVATRETQRKLVATQQATARVAREQTRRAETNLGLASRTEKRLAPLTEKGYVPVQQLDQARVAALDAVTSLHQARQQEDATRRAVDSDAAAEAGVRAAAAALANAKRALQDTEIHASHDGRVTGLAVSSGELVVPGQSLFTLINTEEWFAVANFRETELRTIKPGNCATVYSMIDRTVPIKGEVESLGFGVLAADRINLPRSVPYVQPSVNWVHVAQRFPVRVRLARAPEALTRMGASAVVEVGGGAACR